MSNFTALTLIPFLLLPRNWILFIYNRYRTYYKYFLLCSLPQEPILHLYVPHLSFITFFFF
ncbi:hypothetical protein C1646_695287 [Rhizophagus diaphanus]|nr:hypothetical protein C1646_695287 [Rhizophagus diaphanus] [Rhizophagus sp. MUCL 43196]